MKVSVVVHPNSRKPRVEKDLLGQIHVYVNAPPLEGKANRAVIETLAEYFGVKKNEVRLVLGEKTKRKIFEIVKQ
jgi:uncharacterized protein (TIGR00251 family)